MTATDLQAFCATEARQPRLTVPRSIGEWSYASNGMLCIRVPRLPDVPEADETTAHSNCPRLFETEKPGPEWFDLPELPPRKPAQPCARCSGVQKPRCAACDGTGEVTYEFWHGPRCYIREEECPVCEGETECRRCHGALVEPHPEEVAGVEIGGVLIRQEFVRLLSALPNCQLAPRDQFLPIAVRFDGGEGYVMPMRRL